MVPTHTVKFLLYFCIEPASINFTTFVCFAQKIKHKRPCQSYTSLFTSYVCRQSLGRGTVYALHIGLLAPVDTSGYILHNKFTSCSSYMYLGKTVMGPKRTISLLSLNPYWL